MARQLTPKIANAVNALVERGGHFNLSVHDVPVESFAVASDVKVWPADAARASYLSGNYAIDDYELRLYSVDLPTPILTESIIPPALVPVGHEDYPEERE